MPVNKTSRFYLKFDYRAVYLGYLDEERDEFREYPYTPSGIELSEAIRDYFQNSHHLLIGRWTVESIFTDKPSNEGLGQLIEIRGRNLSTGEPDLIRVKLDSIIEHVQPLLKQLANHISLNWEHHIPSKLHQELKLSGLNFVVGDFPIPEYFEAIIKDNLTLSLN